MPSDSVSPSREGILPQTPERPISQEGEQTYSAQPTRFRLRRRPAGHALSGGLFLPISSDTDNAAFTDMPIPSIEIGTDCTDSIEQSPIRQSDSFLSPITSYAPDLPTTPAAQTASFDGDSWTTAKQRELGEAIVRPLSQCSGFSSSSQESDTSSTCASSYGTTCTSPDRGFGDPFFTPSKDERFNFSKALLAAGKVPDLTPTKPKAKVHWTAAMDDHLWMTYQLYLQDPTLTPIKTLPGNAPPLGVCHRVARQAKQTWKDPKLRPTNPPRYNTPQPVGSPRQHDRIDGSASDAELIGNRTHHLIAWPKMSATRRRLRELAKNRATIAPHYMRLIANRTPSPFTSSTAASSRHTSTGHRAPSSCLKYTDSKASPDMGARDVRLALTTATAESMQPDGPLARLQRDTPQPSPETTPAPAALLEFSEADASPTSPAPVSSPTAHHRTSADHAMTDAPAEQPPRLGSPWVPSHSHTWAAPGRRLHGRSGLASSTFAQIDKPAKSPNHLSAPRDPPRPSTSTGPRSLRSPIQFTSSFPYDINRSLGKRRAEHSLEDAASPRHISHRRPQLNVTELFGAGASRNREGPHSPVEQRRVRLRGFSLGDAILQSQHARHRKSQTPSTGVSPGEDPFVDSSEAATPASLFTSSVASSSSRPLGSPVVFSTMGSRPSRFRVRHLPHNSLDSYPEGLFGSIGERLHGSTDRHE